MVTLGPIELTYRVETSFCTLKQKLCSVEISIFSRVIPGNFIPLSVLVPEALGALFIDYFVCHDRSIKMDDLINVQPIIGPGVFWSSIFNDGEGHVLQSQKRLQLRIGQVTPDNISISEVTFNKRIVNLT